MYYTYNNMLQLLIFNELLFGYKMCNLNSCQTNNPPLKPRTTTLVTLYNHYIGGHHFSESKLKASYTTTTWVALFPLFRHQECLNSTRPSTYIYVSRHILKWLVPMEFNGCTCSRGFPHCLIDVGQSSNQEP